MSNSIPAAKPAQSGPNSDALQRALADLRQYDRGSGRGALVPLDQAVAAAETDAQARLRIETQLLVALKESPSVVAREYICAKLTRVGSDAAVPALAALLGDAALSLAARNALVSIGSKPVRKAMRDSLPKLKGRLKVGAIDSLGLLRDTESVRALVRALSDAEPEVVHAALAALGSVGSVKAARALRAWVARSRSTGQPAADALLACAERLRAERHNSEAQTLYRLLTTTAQPGYVQAAAQRGLAGLSGE